MKKFKSVANHLAVISGVKLIAFLIVVVVAIYGDVAFLQIVGSSFPSGLLSGLAFLGAFTTTGSVIGLYIGKQRWFRPGGQLLWAWIFTGVEFTVLMLNCLLAFAIYRHSVDHNLQMWLDYCPITPFISAAGWVLITMLDPEQKQYHEDMEMEDDMKSAERAHSIAAHTARMEVRRLMLEQHTAYLVDEVNSTNMQQGIRTAAKRLAAQELYGLAGFPVAPGLQSPVVDGSGHSVQEDGHQPSPTPAVPQPAQNLNSDSYVNKDYSSPFQASPLDVSSQPGNSNGNGRHDH